MKCVLLGKSQIHTVFIHEGKIAEQGSPDEMFNQPQTEELKRFLNVIK